MSDFTILSWWLYLRAARELWPLQSNVLILCGLISMYGSQVFSMLRTIYHNHSYCYVLLTHFLLFSLTNSFSCMQLRQQKIKGNIWALFSSLSLNDPGPRVLLCLCLKTSLSAKPFIWKWVPPAGSFSCKSKSFIALRLVLKQRLERTGQWPILDMVPGCSANVGVRCVPCYSFGALAW